MKKLFLFFVATIISNPAMAYNIYDNGNLSVDVDGEFAGYGLYNSSNANYDKTFRGVAYGILGYMVHLRPHRIHNIVMM